MASEEDALRSTPSCLHSRNQSDAALAGEDMVNVQMLHNAFMENQEHEKKLIEECGKPMKIFSIEQSMDEEKHMPKVSPFLASPLDNSNEISYQGDFPSFSSVDKTKGVSNTNQKSKENKRENGDLVDISKFDVLKIYVNESKIHPFSKIDIEEDHHSFCFNKMDFNIFMENFTDNAAEYSYQNWNHFSKREDIKFAQREIKNKKPVTSMDFTEKEKEEKLYLDKLPMYKLIRNACLKYQYSPDYCFNSMIDVIEISKIILKKDKNKSIEDEEDEDEVPSTTKMVYCPRVFDEKFDSLYQEGEFPILNTSQASTTLPIPNALKTKSRNFLRTNTVMYLERGLKEEDPMHRVRVMKRDIYKTSQALIQKSFFLVKDSEHKANLVQQTLSHKAKFEKRHTKSLRQNTGIKKETSNINVLSEKFLYDFVEVDTKHANQREKEDNLNDSEDLEPEEWYDGIIEQEEKKVHINQLNWSGEQVQESTKYTKNKILLSIAALNDQNLEIWLNGFKGHFRMMRNKLRRFITKPYVEKFLMVCVIVNTFILTLDGLVPKNIGFYLVTINNYFTLIFLTALILRVTANGPKVQFRSLLNILDGMVVTLSVTEMCINFTVSNTAGGSAISAFRVLRIFRIFKVLRLTRFIKTLKFMIIIISVIGETIGQFVYISILLLIFLFIYALLGMQIYGAYQFDLDLVPRLGFKTFTGSYLSLLQMLTFDKWVESLKILYNSGANQTLSLCFLITWIVIGNYIFFNLFLALLLGGFESERVVRSIEETQDLFRELQERIKHNQASKTKELQALNEKRIRESQDIKYIVSSENRENFNEDEALFHLFDTERQKNRSPYYLSKSYLNQESSLDDILYSIIHEKEREKYTKSMRRKMQEEIYKNVTCRSTLYLFAKNHPVRKFAARVVSHPCFEPVIIFLIILSSLKLVAETYVTRTDPGLNLAFKIFDNIVTVLFVFEALFKILRNGIIQDEGSYFKEPWNVVDFIIVLASLLDMLTPFSLTMVKIVRALRPLRFVSRYKNMKIVVNSLVGIFGPILNASVIILVVWVIFAILAMNFVGEKLFYCDIKDPYNVSKDQCNALGKQWRVAYWNFDNIGESMVTLFVLSTLEGWPTIVLSSVDAGDSETSGPIYNNNVYMWLYFLSFMLVSSFFLMNLFVGVIFYHYGEELEKEFTTDCHKATPDQVKWIMMQKLIFSADSTFKRIEYPKSKFRRWCFILMNSKAYEIGMFIAIVVNIMVLAMDYEGMPDSYFMTISVINDIFTFAFLMEMVVKLIAFKCDYFKDKWNFIDFFIVLVSLADFITNHSFNTGSGIIRLQFAKGFRVIRIIRLIKLFKNEQMAKFNRLINSLIFSLPAMVNVLTLLFLVYCVFAVMACFIYRDATPPEDFERNNISFKNFHSALLTLFRCSTGEDWPLIMYKYGDSDGNYSTSRIFFVVFILVTTIILMNLIDLVVVSIFENFYFDPESPLLQFEEIISDFNKTWNAFTMKHRGQKIHYLSLPRFFATLQEPMGFRVKEEEKKTEIVDLITNQTSFTIRKPFLGITLILSLYNLPV